jgi:hypothetical protein
MKESPISREGWSKVIPRLTISVWMMKVFYGSRTACYVVECDTCQRVKTDHMRPIRLLQPLNIPAWKWEDISMDLIVGLPLSAYKFDSIWAIVDRLIKSTHFIPVHTNYRAEKYAELCVTRILCLHGAPKTIISDRGP